MVPGDPLAVAVSPGASVAALRRSNLNNDVLFVGLDGGIWDVSQFGTGSWRISEVPGTPLLSNAGSRIAAVARAWNKLDVFFANILGSAQTAFWSEDLGTWSVTPTTGSYRAGGGISAVTRSPFNLDAFFVDGAGVANVAWNNWNGPNGDQWILTRALANAGAVSFPLGENIAATARLPVQMDVFDLTLLLAPYTEFWSGSSWGSSLN